MFTNSDVYSFMRVLKGLIKNKNVKMPYCGDCPVLETCIILFGGCEKSIDDEHGVGCFCEIDERDLVTIEYELNSLVKDDTNEQ